MPQLKTFRDLGVDDSLAGALHDSGITHPFPIQELTLPMALKGSDIIGQARTGTGKTLAFGLPLLQRLDPARAVTQALVVVPTRELCLQVTDDLAMGERRGITNVSVYGGVAYETQIAALTGGVHVVIGTPGRLLDHLGKGNLDLSRVTTLVLDEADEMLDMGFLPDVERLVEACPEERHTMLFSATMPSEVVKLARRYMRHPTFMRADVEEHEVAPTVEQHFLHVHRMDKPRVLARLLQTPGRGASYVFVRTKHMADRLVSELDELGVEAIAVHGDLRQQTRERNMQRFRAGNVDVLVATEVAARGLDVGNATHVVNYDCPDDEKMYLHRIGRTARAGGEGVAITFAQFNEVDRLNMIRKAVGATDRQVEEVFSTSDRLTELFDLPAQRPWDHLARSSRSARGSTRPEGSSDGRPKSPRASEGRGERTRAGADRVPRRRGRSPEHDRGRTDARRRRDTPDAHDPATGRDRTRTRTRARRRDEGAGGSAGGGAQARDRSRAGGDSDGRDRERARREGDGAARGGAARSRGGRAREGSRRADERSGAHQRTSDRRRDGHDAATPRPAPRGEPARGEGHPQLARRVKVEHLP